MHTCTTSLFLNIFGWKLLQTDFIDKFCLLKVNCYLVSLSLAFRIAAYLAFVILTLLYPDRLLILYIGTVSIRLANQFVTLTNSF